MSYMANVIEPLSCNLYVLKDVAQMECWVLGR